MARVLVVDDEEGLRSFLAEALEDEGYAVAPSKRAFASGSLRAGGKSPKTGAKELYNFVMAEGIGYPVVLKLYSETITHKTDVGGVQLNLRDADAVRAAGINFADVLARGASKTTKAAGGKTTIADFVHNGDSVSITYHDAGGTLTASQVRVRVAKK